MSKDQECTPELLNGFLKAQFPQIQSLPQVEAIENGEVHLRTPFQERNLRPGGTISGPVMMALADTTAYMAIVAHLGDAVMAVTSNLNIHFLRRPPPEDLTAIGRIRHIGRRSAVVIVEIYSKGSDRAVAHATVSYALP